MDLCTKLFVCERFILQQSSMRNQGNDLKQIVEKRKRKHNASLLVMSLFIHSKTDGLKSEQIPQHVHILSHR